MPENVTDSHIEDEDVVEGEVSLVPSGPTGLAPYARAPDFPAFDWVQVPDHTPAELIRQRKDGVLYVAWQEYADVLDRAAGKGNWWAEEVETLVKPYTEERKNNQTNQVEEVQVEEVIWRGWLVVPGLPACRRLTDGSMVKRKGMTYADAKNSAKSNALRRACIELGIYRDVAGDMALVPTADQITAIRNTYMALRKKVGDAAARKVVEDADCGQALDPLGNIEPEKLTREEVAALLKTVAAATVEASDD